MGKQRLFLSTAFTLWSWSWRRCVLTVTLVYKNCKFHCHCRGSGGKSPPSHSVGPALKPGQSMWDLLRTKYFCFSPVSIISPMLHTHLHLHVALTRRTNGWDLGTFHKATLFRKLASIRKKSISTFASFSNLTCCSDVQMELTTLTTTDEASTLQTGCPKN